MEILWNGIRFPKQHKKYRLYWKFASVRPHVSSPRLLIWLLLKFYTKVNTKFWWRNLIFLGVVEINWPTPPQEHILPKPTYIWTCFTTTSDRNLPIVAASAWHIKYCSVVRNKPFFLLKHWIILGYGGYLISQCISVKELENNTLPSAKLSSILT